ncbi:MAG: helix-turn-helix domain-containing protein [Anaerolineae bacterium]|nr:helix-turn-helix domain-containing protein [Anaerolineae bacterium]
MPKRLVLREVSLEELKALQHLAQSQVDSPLVRRAMMIARFYEGQRAADIACEVGCSTRTIYNQVHRFNEMGLDSLGDGRFATLDPDHSRLEVCLLRVISRTNPSELGLDYFQWTLDRLHHYAEHQLHISVPVSQIASILSLRSQRAS